MSLFNKRNRFNITILIIWIAFAGFEKGFCNSASADSEIITSSRTMLEKWIETERIISKESKELELAKQMLNNRIQLVSCEIESLKTRIDDSKKSIAEADKKRQELIDENEKLKTVSSNLVDGIAVIEQRLQQSLKMLPAPIQERVKPLSQRLPEKSQQSKSSISERFQNAVGILNEIDKFNRDITVVSELRELNSNKKIEVVSIYIGIGQSYYVNIGSELAGVGSLSRDGWYWQEDNSIFEMVNNAVAIIKNEKMASFVRLPATIK